MLLLLLLARLLPRVTTVPALPLLAPWYRLVGNGERLLLEYAQSLVVLEGAAVRSLLPALLPLLDGTRSVDDLVSRLGPPARPAIEGALRLLVEHGAVIEGPDAPADLRDAARAVAAGHRLTPAAAAERLRRAAIGIVGSGPARVEVARLLGSARIGSVRRFAWNGRGRCDLAVVVPAADELDRLPAWNRRALASDQPFLLVRPWDGRMAAIGPLVLPGETCCYECVLLRRGANSGFGADLAEVEVAPLAVVPDPAVAAIAAAVAAHVAVRWAIGADRSVPGVLYAVETQPELRLSTHTVLRVPRCPACSAAERAAPPLPWHPALAA